MIRRVVKLFDSPPGLEHIKGMRSPALFLSLLIAALTAPAHSQTPPPAAPKNMLSNPSFETGFRRENLWDGVDTTGLLMGDRGALPVLTTSGTIAEQAMPVSVSAADLNGDQLQDLAVMDPLGYLRVYFNSGTPKEPKFTIGELGSIFLSRIDPKDPTLQGVTAKHARQGQRIHLSDITRSGKKDLVIGNYLGEIMILMNGSGVRPEFRQPSNIAQVIIPTMKDSLKKWGNVFAPATWDWNKDGKDDLLLGEGSYSANSIHLLLNQGSGAKPVFEENNRSVLAYGMGLEQLTPCIVDYNGDGNLDVLVTERTGKVAVYLNSGKPWKPGEHLPFHSFIPIGGAKPAGAAPAGSLDPMDAAKGTGLLTVGGIATITSGDFNGDGLFDLVFGKSNGRVAMSLNSGTKAEPKFGAPVEIKGDAGTLPFTNPSGWEADIGLDRGNFYGFASVVKETDDAQAQPADGKACLKLGYFPSPNKIMAIPAQYTPASVGWKAGTGDEISVLAGSPASYFGLTQSGSRPLKNNTTYSFSMKVKGARVTDAAVGITLAGSKELSAAKLERGERDSVVKKENLAKDEIKKVFRFNPGPQWSEIKGEFAVKFSNKDLASAALDGKDGRLTWSVSIVANLAPGASTLYLDDLKIIEK